MMIVKPEQNTIILIYLNHFGMPAFSQARWFNRTSDEMGKKENKKDKGQSDEKKSSPDR